MGLTKVGARVAGGALVAVLLWGSAAAAPAAGPAVSSAAADGRGISVTLLTGDRVTVGSGGTVAIRSGEGRERVRFAVNRTRDGVYVIPDDAQPLLRSGRLDRRLFDVRGLVQAGYHDAARSSLPLLVTYRAGAATAAGGTLAAAGVEVNRQLPAIEGAAAAVRKGQTTLWSALTGPGTLSASVDKVWLDGQRELLLDQSVPQIGTPAAWEAGYTGRGVTVVVLDSGVDATHPDLAGKVGEARNFSEAADATDTTGHGTHVASIIAGGGVASGGRLRGVAPDATLFSGKVCRSTACSESAVLAGMHWAAAEKHATVVNLSLGGADAPGVDPVEEAVNTLTTEYGTLFVAAAGNRGCTTPVSSPASADAAVAVGAVDRAGSLAPFSSCGPRLGDVGMKPDITAPGVGIVAARAAGTAIGEPVDDHYTTASGTSMATPHVAGAAALLAQQHPDWTAGRLKATLMAAATPTASLTAFQQGAGRVDVARAIAQTVTTDPVSVSFGKTSWPHQDDEPVAKTVTYHNDGSADVLLDVSVVATGPDGEPAPAGLFTSSAATLTLPAGGQAQITVTSDTRVSGPDGLYSGHLVAAAGTMTVRTPIGVHKEREMYNLTVANLDAAGAHTADYFMALYGLDTTDEAVPYDPDGTVTLRLPRGRYGMFSHINTGANSALLLQPTVDLTTDTTVTLDARQARPINVTVPDPTARPVQASVRFDQTLPLRPSVPINYEIIGDSFDGVATAYLGDPVPADQISSHVSSQWAKPDAGGGFNRSPYLYVVADTIPATFPSGYTHNYQRGELATVRHEFHAAVPGLDALRAVTLENGPSSSLLVDAPGQRVEYYSGGARVMWTDLEFGVYQEGFLDAQTSLMSERTSYRPGRTYSEKWNAGPFGPAFNQSYDARRWVTRSGDTVHVDMPLFSDQYGHAGFSLLRTGRAALYRNGVLLGESDTPWDVDITVPADAGAYRLETSATRDVSDLTTRIDATWTFQSGHAHGNTPTVLPIRAVRFAPNLDTNNAAPAGRRFDIPVTVQHQPGAPIATIDHLTVQVSYDDGATWRPAILSKTRDGWTATVTHPAGAAFTSLRAEATDSAGNTVSQTITHAYRLAAP